MNTRLTPCDTLVTAQYLLMQAQSEPVRGKAVAVTNGVVTAIDTLEVLRRIYLPRTVLDCGNSIIMPGLINGHTHASMTLLRGLADDLPLFTWLNEHIFPMERKLDAELIGLGAMLACAEMTRFGVTAFTDMYLAENAVFEAADTAGLRMLGGEAIFAFPSHGYTTEDEAFTLIEEQAARWKNHPRIRVAVMPHAVYTTTPALLERSRDMAEKLHLPIHIHIAENRTEVENCLNAHGKTPLRYCHEHGILTDHTSIAHGVVFDDEELDLLASSGASVIHCPRSNMKLSSGVARVPEMLKRGITVGLGTDGAASSNNLNVTAEMFAAALLHKVTNLDSTAVPAQSVLGMATEGNAKALCWPELGVIAEGRPADIIAVDFSAPHMQPVHSPVSNLVYAATGSEVRMTMVAGEVLYKDGEYTRIDFESLCAKAAEASARLRR